MPESANRYLNWFHGRPPSQSESECSWIELTPILNWPITQRPKNCGCNQLDSFRRTLLSTWNGSVQKMRNIRRRSLPLSFKTEFMVTLILRPSRPSLALQRMCWRVKMSSVCLSERHFISVAVSGTGARISKSHLARWREGTGSDFFCFKNCLWRGDVEL